MQPDYTGIAVRLRGSISDSWSGDAFAADAEVAEEAAKALIEARDTIADMLATLKSLVRDCMASDFNEHWQSFKDAEAAISKATGAQ